MNYINGYNNTNPNSQVTSITNNKNNNVINSPINRNPINPINPINHMTELPNTLLNYQSNQSRIKKDIRKNNSYSHPFFNQNQDHFSARNPSTVNSNMNIPINTINDMSNTHRNINNNSFNPQLSQHAQYYPYYNLNPYNLTNLNYYGNNSQVQPFNYNTGNNNINTIHTVGQNQIVQGSPPKPILTNSKTKSSEFIDVNKGQNYIKINVNDNSINFNNESIDKKDKKVNIIISEEANEHNSDNNTDNNNIDNEELKNKIIELNNLMAILNEKKLKYNENRNKQLEKQDNEILEVSKEISRESKDQSIDQNKDQSKKLQIQERDKRVNTNNREENNKSNEEDNDNNDNNYNNYGNIITYLMLIIY